MLAFSTQICNFNHKFNFSAETHILTKFFAISVLVGQIGLRFVSKSDKKQSFTKPLRLASRLKREREREREREKEREMEREKDSESNFFYSNATFIL